MPQVITAKLKLILSTEQKVLVRETALAYRDALNYTSETAFDNGKSGNGLEELTGIRGRTKSKSGKKASKKQPRANRNKAKWSLAERHSFVNCKAVLNGSLAVKVMPHYTSQSCPKCGNKFQANRPNKGLLLGCECCGHELHTDLVGSKNIALRTLLIRQGWMSTGVLSAPPNVSDKQAKAEILLRFSELQSSSDASFNYSGNPLSCE